VLALDIGNGSIKFAEFEEGRRLHGGRLALGADPAALPAAGDVAVVSVNPDELERLRGWRPDLRVVGRDLPLTVPVRYDPPGDLGSDRVMAVVGALHRCPQAAAVLVLEAGTCLTATLGERSGGVLGGAIAPGFELMLRAMARGTAALPEVEAVMPEVALGRTTAASLRSGAWAGLIGAARHLIARIGREYGAPLTVVASGTGAGALASELPEIDAVHPFAALWGVYLTALAAR